MCSHPELRWIDVKYETPRSVLIAKLILTGTMMGKASLTQTQNGKGHHPRGLIAAGAAFRAARVAEMYTCRVPRPRPTLTLF